MKKVKITVLKTTLDEELAAEYGAEGPVSYTHLTLPTTPSRMASVTRPGRLSISMCSPWPTGRERVCSITATGSAGPAWPSAPATMGSAP